MHVNPSSAKIESLSRTCIRVEIDFLEPMEKKTLRVNMYSIFAEQSIEDEELVSVNWIKSQTSPGLYSNLMVRFSSKSALEKMLAFLGDEEKLRKAGFSAFRVEEDDSFEMISDASRSMSMSSFLTDGILVCGETDSISSMFNTSETSFNMFRPVSTSSVKASVSSTSTLDDNDDDEKNVEVVDKAAQSLEKTMDMNNNSNEFKMEALELDVTKTSSLSRENDQKEDNRVEFYSNADIQDADVDYIILYVENRRASGGGDTIAHELDGSRRFLTVTYQNPTARRRVLDKTTHTFGKFALNANEPFDRRKFPLDSHAIVLCGISTEMDDLVLRLYAENLVVNDDEENDVERIEKSKLLRGVVYVKFKNPIEAKNIQKRIEKRPKIRGGTVSLMRAYLTNMVVVKLLPNTREVVEEYFSNRERCSVEPFAFTQVRNSFMFMAYKNEKDCLNVISREHLIGKNQVTVEYLHNFDLFENGEASHQIIEHQQQQQPQREDETQDETMILETSQMQREAPQEIPLQEEVPVKEEEEEDDDNDDEKQEDEEAGRNKDETKEEVVVNSNSDNNNQPVQQPRIFLELSINQEPKLKILKEIVDVIEKFENELRERDAVCEPTAKNDGSLQIVCTRQFTQSLNDINAAVSEWQKNVLKYLSEFFKQFVIECLDLRDPKDIYPLPASIKMDPSRCRVFATSDSVSETSLRLTIMGFREDVDTLIASIMPLIDEQENVEDSITGLTLPQVRILMINKYDREMATLFGDDFICDINSRELCVNYFGKRRQIEDAKNWARVLLENTTSQAMPLDEVVVRFIEEREKQVVIWLKRELRNKCVLNPIRTQSILEVYSADSNELPELCKKIKSQFEPLVIDASLVGMVEPRRFNEFLNKLQEDPDIVFTLSPAHGLKICAFKEKRDQLYNMFLLNLPD